MRSATYNGLHCKSWPHRLDTFSTQMALSGRIPCENPCRFTNVGAQWTSWTSFLYIFHVTFAPLRLCYRTWRKKQGVDEGPNGYGYSFSLTPPPAPPPPKKSMRALQLSLWLSSSCSSPLLLLAACCPGWLPFFKGRCFSREYFYQPLSLSSSSSECPRFAGQKDRFRLRGVEAGKAQGPAAERRTEGTLVEKWEKRSRVLFNALSQSNMPH